MVAVRIGFENVRLLPAQRFTASEAAPLALETELVTPLTVTEKPSVGAVQRPGPMKLPSENGPLPTGMVVVTTRVMASMTETVFD